MKIGFLKGARNRYGKIPWNLQKRVKKQNVSGLFPCCRRPFFLCPTSHEVVMCLLATVPSLPWPWSWTHAQTGMSDAPYEIWYMDTENVFLFLLDLNQAHELSSLPCREPIYKRNQNSNMARNLGFWWHLMNPWIQPWLKQALPLNSPAMWAKVFLFIVRV